MLPNVHSHALRKSPALLKLQQRAVLVYNSLSLDNKIMQDSQYFILPSLKKRVFTGRRTLSITLKMPDININSRKTSPLKIKPFVEIIRTSSVAGNYRNKPQVSRDNSGPKVLRQTFISFKLNTHPDITPYCFSPIRTKYSPVSSKVPRNRELQENVPEITVKSEKKKKNTNAGSFDNTMNDYLLEFYSRVKRKYEGIYEMIDRLKRGFFDIDDIIDYFIMEEIENTEKVYDKIKVHAKVVYQALIMVSDSKKVYKTHFLAFCSVFEHNKGENLDLKDSKAIKVIKEQIIELKELFECFTNQKIIDIRSLLAEINFKERITKCRVFVESDKITFSRFLRCLPFFVWLYNSINSMT